MRPPDTILTGFWGLAHGQTAWELETVSDRGRRLNPLRWSLQGQIRALGVMVFATVVLAVVLGVLLLRQSQSARVADASRHLDRAVDQLAERYAYLRRSFDERHAVAPLAAGDESLLHSLTEATLVSAPGVEGSFYRAVDRRLLGYAYPTYDGSGPKTDIPEAERPTIQRVVEMAVDRGMPAAERVLAGRISSCFGPARCRMPATPWGPCGSCSAWPACKTRHSSSTASACWGCSSSPGRRRSRPGSAPTALIVV